MKKSYLIVGFILSLHTKIVYAYNPLFPNFDNVFTEDIYDQKTLSQTSPKYEKEAIDRLYELKEERLIAALGARLQPKLSQYQNILDQSQVVQILTGIVKVATGAPIASIPVVGPIINPYSGAIDSAIDSLTILVQKATLPQADTQNLSIFRKEIEDLKLEMGALKNGLKNENIKKQEEYYVTHKKNIPLDLQKSIEKALIKSRLQHGYGPSNPIDFIDMALQLPTIHKNLFSINDWETVKKDYQQNEFFNFFSDDLKRDLFLIMKQTYLDSQDTIPPLRSSYYFWGNPGVGKTEAAREIARFHKLPYHEVTIGDTSNLSDKDFVGVHWAYTAGNPGWFADVFLNNKEGENYTNSILIINEFDRLLNDPRSNQQALRFLLNVLDPKNREIKNQYFNSFLDISRLTIIITANSDIPQGSAYDALRSRFMKKIVHFPDITQEQAKPRLVELCEDYMFSYHTFSEASEEIVEKVFKECPSGPMRDWELLVQNKVLELEPDLDLIRQEQAKPRLIELCKNCIVSYHTFSETPEEIVEKVFEECPSGSIEDWKLLVQNKVPELADFLDPVPPIPSISDGCYKINYHSLKEMVWYMRKRILMLKQF